MNNQGKTAPQANAKAAYIKQLQRHYTGTIKRLKLEFIRLAVWWRIAWGTLI